jgi:hypothetical protein
VEEERAHIQDEVSKGLDKLFNWENSAPLYTENRAIYDQERTAWLNARQYRNHFSTYGDEYKVMADVHGYFQVASAVSNLCLHRTSFSLNLNLPSPSHP